MKINPLAKDVTAYARSIGYRGTKPVYLLDGKVVSHRGADWYRFCDLVRRTARN